MRNSYNLTIYIFVEIILIACAVMGVQINYMRVPSAVKNNTGEPVLLDCDYTVRPTDVGLVIKWFLNGETSMVYQWIPTKKPQSIGLLKDRVDLTYKVSEDPYTMYRALRIMNPTTELSGEYRCFVSTFSDEDFSSRHMTVFEPEEEMSLHQTKPHQGRVNISCYVVGVYPEPNLILFISPDRKTRKSVEDVQMRSQKLEVNGRFDISVFASVAEGELMVADSIFDCELSIPRTGYVKRISRIYYPEGTELNNSQWNPISLSFHNSKSIIILWAIMLFSFTI